MMTFPADVISARRSKAEQAFGDARAVVIAGAGGPIARPGRLDMTYPFLPHPDYYWLTGLSRPGSALAYDPAHGWSHFVAPVTPEESLWTGGARAPEGADVAELANWVAARAGRPLASLGCPVQAEGFDPDPELSATLRERLDAARRPKDAAELALLARAVRATAAGHARAREVIRPGATEREVGIEVNAALYHHGADDVGYDTIVGAGAHAAILHYTSWEGVIAAHDLVLVDAAGSIQGYTADVTRTFPAGRRFTPEQQAIYDLVLAAEEAAIERCRVGVEWHDVHRTAAAVLAGGLVELGVLRGKVDDLLETEAIALFLPHGIGHMVGLGVRDVGGRAPGREPGRFCCGARVRVDLPLAAGFVMTVEPGIYFVPVILDDPERRARFGKAVAWDALERWRRVGGVRIEDDVLITAQGPDVLTAGIPK